jgi:hypothetical protein
MQKEDYWSEDRKGFPVIRFIGFILIPIIIYIIPFEWVKDHNSICLYKNITGHECYGCGMTKAIFSAIHFNFTDAFYYNKLVIIVLPVLIYIWAKNILNLRTGIFQSNLNQPVTSN